MTATTDREIHDVSAFFARVEDVERAVGDLVENGVPRDLIELAVSPEANAKRYGGKVRRRGSQTVRFAGIGALVGLFAGMALSLEIIVAFQAFEPPARELSIAQFLGPNVGMMIGALIGALVGLFVKRSVAGPLRRVGERDGILMIVHSQPQQRDAAIRGALEANRAQDVVITREYRRPRRRWLV